MSDYSRIEELENALEALLECFDRSFEGRPWIEVEVEMNNDACADGCIITEGQVNKTTADAIAIAEAALYDERCKDSEGYEGV